MIRATTNNSRDHTMVQLHKDHVRHKVTSSRLHNNNTPHKVMSSILKMAIMMDMIRVDTTKVMTKTMRKTTMAEGAIRI
jgi:hypothetical protein